MMDRSLYPKNWNSISQREGYANAFEIKQGVNWVCENCARPCRKSGESLEDFEERVIEGSEWAIEYWDSVDDDEEVWYRRSKRFELQVAHLDHIPSNCDRSNLRALCTPCHCRYDLSQMGRKKLLRRERSGFISGRERSDQLNLVIPRSF